MSNETQTDLAEVLRPATCEALDERATLMAAGFDDWAAHCALRTEKDGGFCHAYFYSDGFWHFQTGGGDLHQSDGKVLRCVLTKRLYAVPQSLSTDLANAEQRVKELEGALSLALQWLEPYEPGDSRAVSNEFVAMAAVLGNWANEQCMPIIRAALTGKESA